MRMKVSLRSFMTKDDVIYVVSSFRSYCVEMLVAALLCEVVPTVVKGAEQSRAEEYRCQYTPRLSGKRWSQSSQQVMFRRKGPKADSATPLLAGD